MNKARDIIWSVVDALSGMEVLHVSFETPSGNLYDATLAEVGWGGVTFFVWNGRPLVGVEWRHVLRAWLGPWYWYKR